MDRARLVKVSKYLARHLRHDPGRLGLRPDRAGWVAVDDLLAACARHGLRLSRADLDEVVRRNDKARYAYDPSGTRIRASQGHSIEVDLGLPPVPPPPVLWHGTAAATLPAIRAEGLCRMRRRSVHLSPDPGSARTVGARHGRPAVLRVDAAGLHAAGVVFTVSANGVWLVDAVPPAYLQEER